MKKALLVGALVFFNSLVVQAQAPKPQAQPPCASGLDATIASGLRGLLASLPLEGSNTPKSVADYLLSPQNLKASSAQGCSAEMRVRNEADKIQLHAFIGKEDQALVLIYRGTIDSAAIFRSNTLNALGKVQLTNPVFSLSLRDAHLETKELPAGFKKVVADSYFNVPFFELKGGYQVAANVRLGGVMKTFVEIAVGVKPAGASYAMRAAMVEDKPSAPESGAAERGRASLDALKRYKEYAEEKEKEKKKEAKEPPELFVEITPKPGTVVTGPLGMSAMNLTDATFSITSKGTVGYKGNVTFPAIKKKFVAFLETPLKPDGAFDILDARFGLATPQLNLAEFAYLGTMGFSPTGRPPLFAKLAPLQASINAMNVPLSTVILRNPVPVPTYVLGDPKNGYFPPVSAFNIAVLGPLAEMPKAKDQKEADKGPLLRLVGEATVLGQKMSRMNVDFSESGLKGTANGSVSLDLSKVVLGRPGISMTATVDVTGKAQTVGLGGSFAGRTLNIGMNASSISVNSPAICATPVEVRGSLKYAQAAPTFGQVTSAINGVNVDPAKIPQCVGEALKAAYRWIGDNGAKLGGYTVAAAKEAGRALEQGGKAVGAAVAQGGVAVAQGAQVAAKATSDFVSGKWKHHPGRPVYDCANQDPATNPKLAEAYPPGRLWGSREDYKSRGMNFARYVFGADRKFHPILGRDAKRTLGGTACGGLVGEEGVGYGRLNTADDEIWTKAVFCQVIPKEMIGAPVNNPTECYAARGLSKPRPDLASKVIGVKGRPELHVVNASGSIRWIPNLKIYNACALPPPGQAIYLASLHEIYQIPMAGGPVNSADECLSAHPAGQQRLRELQAQRDAAAQAAAQKAAQAQQARQAYLNSLRGQFLAYCDVYKNTHLIGNDGRRHWIANKDKWWVFNGCNKGAGVRCVSLAEIQAIPEGAAIGTVDQCNALK